MRHTSSMPLFDARPGEEAGARPVPLNSSVPDEEAPRLSLQHEAILDALREGPKTNLQLGMIAQRFGGRLHELKRAGHPWTKRCLRPGIYEYRLVGEAAAE